MHLFQIEFEKLKKKEKTETQVMETLMNMLYLLSKRELEDLMQLLNSLQYDNEIKYTVYKFSEPVFQLINREI